MLSTKWLLALYVGFVLFTNHYARDSLGALEMQMESQPLGLSVLQYSSLASSYFFPNIFMPLGAGYLSQAHGPGNTLVAILVVAAAAHITFGFGASFASYPLLLLGKTLQGFCYEATDMCPIPLVAPVFGEQWAVVSGLINACVRAGSVANFIVTPLVYEQAGVVAALWVASAVGSASLACGVGARHCAHRLRAAPAAPAPAAEAEGLLEERGGAEADRAALLAPPAPPSTAPEHPGQAGGGRGRAAAAAGEEDAGAQEGRAEAGRAGAGRGGGGVVAAFMHGVPASFWLYALLGGLMYGSIVPFWFIGSKYIQVKFAVSIRYADALLLLPEGVIVVVGPCIGFVVDRCKPSHRTNLYTVATALVVMSAAYVVLALTHIPPLYPMVVLGVSYSFSNMIYWVLFPACCPASHLSMGSGVVGASLNLLPSLIPLVFSSMEHSGREDPRSAELMILGLLGGAAAAISLTIRPFSAADLSSPTQGRGDEARVRKHNHPSAMKVLDSNL